MSSFTTPDVRHKASAFKHHFSGFTWRLWYAVALFGMMGVSRGIEEALVATMVVQESFKSDFGLNDMSEGHRADIVGNVVAMSQLGCIAGALSTFLIGDRPGRLFWARIMCSIWLIGILVYTTSVGNLGQMYAGKFVVGIGLGQISIIAPAYLAECSHAKNRGFAVATFGATEYFGAIIGYFAGYGGTLNISDDSSRQWKLPQIAQGIFAALFLIMLTFSVESPRILVKKGKHADAQRALGKLRGKEFDHTDVEQEIKGIETQLTAEKESKSGFIGSLLTLFSTRKNLDRLTIAFLAHILQVWSGASSITVYAPEYFQILGVTNQNERLLYTGIMGVVKLVAAASCALFAVDQLGRKRSLALGISVQACAIIYISAVLAVVPELSTGEASGADDRRVGVSAIVSMYLCGAGYAFGWNTISFLIPTEIFTVQTRTVGSALVMVVHFCSRYGVQKVVPLMLLPSSMGPSGTFWFFSAITLIGLIWVWAWLPEAGSIPLEKAAYKIEPEAEDDPWGDGQPGDVSRKMGEMQPKDGPTRLGELPTGSDGPNPDRVKAKRAKNERRNNGKKQAGGRW
ncbi:hypothetical protein Q7P37_007429 [Cladosporium fusiforme]